MLNFLKENYEWIFSGIGSGLLFWILGNRHGYNKAIRQTMKVGNGSTAIQVGRDLKTNIGKDQ